jgi:PAS domain S-box-containing protein
VKGTWEADSEPVKLLLVDDREEDLSALEMILADPAYEFVAVRSGADALKRVLTDDFAVVLLDVMLPGLDGFEVAQLIKQRERSRHTPILFLTAMGSEMNAIYRAYSAGGVDYLTKPIEPDVVRAKVAIFASLFRQDRQIRRQAAALRDAERRERERELEELRRATEARYRNLADAIPGIVWTAAPDGGLAYANRAWYLYTGLDQEQTIGFGWLDAVQPEDRDALLSAWFDVRVEPGVFTREVRLRQHSSASWRAHRVHAIPERDASGAVVGWLGTMSDCEDLRQAIQARDQFLATASHELRTPLASLALATEVLRQLISDAEVSDDVRSGLMAKIRVAARQNERLERLISALLDVTRIAGNRPLLERKECDVAAVVREAVDRLGVEHARTATIELAASGNALGWVDPVRIDQVVTNLVGNAVRYAAGQPVEVKVEASEGHLSIAVRDHGAGIAPEQLAQLFGQFQSIPSKSHQNGLGLGLYISRHIARAHGGDITVVSEVGRGSTFTVELPLDRSSHAAGEESLDESRRAVGGE